VTDALLDTSVLIDLDDPAVRLGLPDRVATSSISLAELAVGPHLAHDPLERARRQTRLQQIESLFNVLDFDVASARSYGQVVAAIVTSGGSHRSRVADLLIAAVAHSNNLALYTRNSQDFAGLQSLLTVVAV
jgi:predicted nucleic acid-binding protein